MSSYGIQIQGCTNGLTTLFISPNLKLDEALKIALDYDERKDASQFAKRSVSYSVQIVGDHRIYSHIDSKVTDNFGRPGYLAFKLIAPKNRLINNFVAILNEIKKKYLLFDINKNLTKQDYSEVFSSIQYVEQNISAIQHLAKRYYVTFKEGEESFLNKLLNIDDVYMVDKLYAFDINKILEEQVGEQLKLFRLPSDFYTKHTIEYELDYLKGIKINGEHLKIHESPFDLLVPIGIQAIAIVGSEKKKDNERIISLPKEVFQKPIVAEEKTQKAQKVSSIKNQLKQPIPIILGVLVLILGLFFLKNTLFNDNEKIKNNNGDASNESIETETKEETGIIQENIVSSPSYIDPSQVQIRASLSKNNNLYFYTEDIEEIKGYAFRPESKFSDQWYYYESLNNMDRNIDLKHFNIENPTEILNQTSISEGTLKLFLNMVAYEMVKIETELTGNQEVIEDEIFPEDNSSLLNPNANITKPETQAITPKVPLEKLDNKRNVDAEPRTQGEVAPDLKQQAQQGS